MPNQYEGQSTTEQVKNSLGEVASQAKQKVSETLDEAKQQANETLGEAKQQAESKFEEQKRRAAERLSGVAGALRQTSQELQPQDDTIAQYADSFAEQVDKLSNYLRERDVRDLFNDVRQVAQRQPELFVAGALAAGFLLGRFLKSSGTPSSTGYPSSQFSPSPYANYGNGGDLGATAYPRREFGEANRANTMGEPYSSVREIPVTGSEEPYGR
jgi:ABC-type transporter Mla subunit MlaD